MLYIYVFVWWYFGIVYIELKELIIFGLCDMWGKICGILLHLFDVNACFGYQDIDLGLCGLVCSPMIFIDICFTYIERRIWSGSFVNRLGLSGYAENPVQHKLLYGITMYLVLKVPVLKKFFVPSTLADTLKFRQRKKRNLQVWLNQLLHFPISTINFPTVLLGPIGPKINLQ